MPTHQHNARSTATAPPANRSAGSGWSTANRSRLPTPLQVLLAVVAMVVASLLPQLPLFAPAVQHWLADHRSASTVVGLLIQVLPAVLVLPIVAGLLRWDSRPPHRRLTDLGHRAASRDHRRLPSAPGSRPLLGLLVGTAGAAAIMLLAGTALNAVGLYRGAPLPVESGPLALVVIAVVLRAFAMQAIPEELIFRGYLLSSLRLSAPGAVLLSSGAFALLHLVSSGGQQNMTERLLYLVLPFGFAMLAGALRVLLDSVPAAVGVHGGVHVGYAICGALGYRDGPWMWVGVGVVMVGISAALLRRASGAGVGTTRVGLMNSR